MLLTPSRTHHGDSQKEFYGDADDAAVYWDGTNWVFEAETGAAVFNEQGIDVDWRAEGLNNANIIVLDAAQDALSFGAANVDGAAFTLNNTTGRTLITSVGAQFHIPAQTTTFDNASGTVAIGTGAFFGIQTYVGDNATLTITNPATVYIAGVPVASTNVTFSNTAYAFWSDAGDVRLDGDNVANLFFIDASNDNIIFGTTSSDPDFPFDIAFPARTVTADQSFAWMRIHTGGAVTVPSGTAGSVSTLILVEPNITATGTVTTAATLIINDAPNEATNNYSIFIDSGVARADHGWIIGTTTSLNNLVDDASGGAGSTTLYIGNQSITTSSDVRIKTDIETWSGSALELLRNAHIVTHAWNDPTDVSEWGRNSRGKYIGMLAQETIKWAPWIVNAGAGRNCGRCLAGQPCADHMTWLSEYELLVPVTIKGIQELEAMYYEQETRFSSIEERVEMVETVQDGFQNGWFEDQLEEALKSDKFKTWIKARIEEE